MHNVLVLQHICARFYNQNHLFDCRLWFGLGQRSTWLHKEMSDLSKLKNEHAF